MSSTKARPRLVGRRFHARAAGAIALVLIAVLVAPLTPGSAETEGAAARKIPAAAGCTNVAGPVPVGLRGLEPAQLRAAYGLDTLIAGGADGAGQSIAILLPGQSLNVDAWQRFSDCFGPFAVPHEQVIGTGAPTPGGEGILDPIAVAIGAPGATIYLFETPEDNSYQPTALPALLAAALNPANTGGELVTAISMSAAGCEAGYTDEQRSAMDTLLKSAFDQGVKTFASAGDGGSGGGSFGASGCPSFPFTPSQPPQNDELGLGYPASSPYVTTVGGTVLRVGTEPERIGSPAAGAVTEVVWNESFPLGGSTDSATWFASGGGRSAVYDIESDAPWQGSLGLTGAVQKPDIVAVAGSPFYPGPYYGTSASAPFMAGAFATLDSYLVLNGAPRTAQLNPLLYGLAADPQRYAENFVDVTEGTNDPFVSEPLGCCDAGAGFDMASGLGSVRFTELAQSLLASSAPSLSATPTAETPSATPGVGPSTPVTPPAPAQAETLANTGPRNLVPLLVAAAAAIACGLLAVSRGHRRL